MDFFGIGPGELVLIIIIGLIVFGPERLADTAKTLGKTVNSFKRAASDLTTQVNKELEETKAAARQFKDEVKDVTKPITEEVNSFLDAGKQSLQVLDQKPQLPQVLEPKPQSPPGTPQQAPPEAGHQPNHD